jgi:hypothetical protein
MIPKPKHCEQNWLDMKPANGGRMCGQCQKKIMDFSKMNWAEIEAVQAANNNTVCGMYNPKQLDNWGREIPKQTYSKVLVTSAMISTFTLSKLIAQNDSLKSNKKEIWVTGEVKSKSEKGKIEEAFYVTVKLHGSNSATSTNENGFFCLKISYNQDSIKTLELVFDGFGLKEKRVKLDALSDKSEIKCNVVLEENFKELEPIMFYVGKPTLRDRVRRIWYRWFHIDT